MKNHTFTNEELDTMLHAVIRDCDRAWELTIIYSKKVCELQEEVKFLKKELAQNEPDGK